MKIIGLHQATSVKTINPMLDPRLIKHMQAGSHNSLYIQTLMLIDRQVQNHRVLLIHKTTIIQIAKIQEMNIYHNLKTLTKENTRTKVKITHLEIINI